VISRGGRNVATMSVKPSDLSCNSTKMVATHVADLTSKNHSVLPTLLQRLRPPRRSPPCPYSYSHSHSYSLPFPIVILIVIPRLCFVPLFDYVIPKLTPIHEISG